MTKAQARNEALIQLGNLFEEESYCTSGLFHVYCQNGRISLQRNCRDMKNRDYYAVLTASDFTHGLSSTTWETLLNASAERIFLQCRSREISKL
jgi:outer membrane receptor for ferric coprogen and ferric-rhodotorulic acid